MYFILKISWFPSNRMVDLKPKLKTLLIKHQMIRVFTSNRKTESNPLRNRNLPVWIFYWEVARREINSWKSWKNHCINSKQKYNLPINDNSCLNKVKWNYQLFSNSWLNANLLIQSYWKINKTKSIVIWINNRNLRTSTAAL